MCILNPARVFTRFSTLTRPDAAACAAVFSRFPRRFTRIIAFAAFHLPLEGK